MDADADGNFDCCGRNCDAGTHSEGCAEERRYDHGEREPATDGFADASDACAFDGVELSERGARQNCDGRDQPRGERGIQRGSDAERERIAERGDGFVEHEWDYAGEWKREFDVDADGSAGGHNEQYNGHCDSVRRWRDCNEDRCAAGSTGAGDDRGAEHDGAVDDSLRYRPGYLDCDAGGWAEADRGGIRGERVAGRGESVVWAGKPVERRRIQRDHDSGRQRVGKDGELERKCCGIDWKQRNPQRHGGVYSFAVIHVNVEMNQFSMN